MERKAIIKQLQSIIAKEVKLENVELTEENTANDVKGWDSLSHIAIIAQIEETFSIKFKLRELAKLKKVGSIIDLIIKKQN
ncbi:MAG: acyl carrier protein [Massilibacteroides sp.]|nr:acyl carrier protein [Massilibacteroides sp.]